MGACDMRQTHPRNFAIEEAVKHMLIRQYWMTSDAVQECLQHALTPCDHSRVLLRLPLFNGIVTYRLFRRYGRYDNGGVKLHQARTQGLEFGISVRGLRIL